ncbi:MAG: type 4a pilus biogenesis protein PilO [Psychrosphaera sp.]|nr:type 4a pilus biogenesis protein PilO [Psychrosphaera sp.]
MKFDFDMSELDINNLDFENVGGWPKPVKIISCVLAAIIVFSATYYFFVADKITTLSTASTEEKTLRSTYRIKYAAAVNLELYRQQMIDMEELFAALLKRLPSSRETPGLLDDITYVGTSSGLSFLGINWLPEVTKQFYTELPITIEVVGKYHEFGDFVAKIAELPRIVTLHDFKIKQLGDGRLNLNIVAKTYRYQSEEADSSEATP